MGTNYYLIGTGKHVGKRSAAGYYCFDCGRTLCSGGDNSVHFGDTGWHDNCPSCGSVPITEKIGESTVGIELGFNKNITEQKQGVRSCSSFTFAIDEKRLKYPMVIRWARVVKDEYGSIYTMKQFMKILNACPIKFYHMIGKEFS